MKELLIFGIGPHSSEMVDSPARPLGTAGRPQHAFGIDDRDDRRTGTASGQEA